MLVEHFIEPCALAELSKSRRNCKDFIREFSKPSPRVIAAYPKFKNLRRLARTAQATTASEQDIERLLELLKFIQDSHLVERQGLFNGALDVLENLKIEEDHYFNGIHLIADELNSSKFSHPTLSVQNFESGIDPLSHQVPMPKVVSGFCKTLGELLRLSKEITIVDPYFSTQPGVWKVFLALMEIAVIDSPVNEKSVHVLFDSEKNKKNGRPCRYLKEQLIKEDTKWLTEGVNITFKDVRENGREATHNRYIITELGAVSIPYGLQETNEHEVDDVTLLSVELYNKRFKQYCELEGVELVDQASIG